MKKMLVVVLMLMVVVSYAAGEKEQIPKDLQVLKDAANKETEAAVKAATQPVLEKYKEQLEELQKKYLAAKDAAGITAVTKELEIVNAKVDAYYADMVGKFKNSTYVIEILPGKKATLSSGFTANVAFKNNHVSFRWNNNTSWDFKIGSSNKFYSDFDGDRDAYIRISDKP